MSPRAKAACDRVIAMMAGHLLLDPVVEPADHGACVERWREQKLPEIAIQEFGPDAKALVQAELHERRAIA